MKISPKFILKVAGTLTVISLVVAAMLGLVNSITADKIAEIDAENTRISMSAVTPRAASSAIRWSLPKRLSLRRRHRAASSWRCIP